MSVVSVLQYHSICGDCVLPMLPTHVNSSSSSISTNVRFCNICGNEPPTLTPVAEIVYSDANTEQKVVKFCLFEMRFMGN